MWYVYACNRDFGKYAAVKDPSFKIGTQILLMDFLKNVGTTKLVSKRDYNMHPEKYRSNILSSYIELPKGTSVYYCLNDKHYLKRLNAYLPK